MKPNDIFSIRDFFNYYLAGVLWLSDIVAVVILVSKLGTSEIKLSDLNTLLNEVNAVVITIGLIVIPYLLGFMLNPLGTKLMEKIRNRDNEAIRWVTDPTHRLAGQGLKEWEKEKIKEKIKVIYKIQNKSFEELFFTIRAYVEEHGKGANLLATRALDLTNFAESLIIPLPLFFTFIGIWLVASHWLWTILFFGIGISVFGFLRRRYLDLRSYWVKHVYRAFIAIKKD